MPEKESKIPVCEQCSELFKKKYQTRKNAVLMMFLTLLNPIRLEPNSFSRSVSDRSEKRGKTKKSFSANFLQREKKSV